jgi:hypothetical protein
VRKLRLRAAAGEHERVRQRVELQRRVVRPVHGLHDQRQRAQVRLLQHGEREVREAHVGVVRRQVFACVWCCVLVVLCECEQVCIQRR